MSIEHRVKPSARVKAALQRRRKFIVIVLVAIVCASLLGVGVYNAIKVRGRQSSLDMNASALRTLLASRTNYNGNWVREDEGLFEVYLPGEVQQSEDFVSLGFTIERDTEYDNSCVRAYGVLKGTTRYEATIEEEDHNILSEVMPDIVEDAGKAHAGRNISGAYDMELVSLNDGRTAIKCVGTLQFTQLLQEPGEGGKVYQETVEQPLEVYITLEKGYPVAIWATYNRDNYIATQEVPQTLFEVVNTLWQTEYAADRKEWNFVPVTTGPDGVIKFDEDEDVTDTPVGDMPAGPQVTPTFPVPSDSSNPYESGDLEGESDPGISGGDGGVTGEAAG